MGKEEDNEEPPKERQWNNKITITIIMKIYAVLTPSSTLHGSAEYFTTLCQRQTDRHTNVQLKKVTEDGDDDDCVETGGLEKFFQGEGRWNMKRMRKEGTSWKQKEKKGKKKGMAGVKKGRNTQARTRNEEEEEREEEEEEEEEKNSKKGSLTWQGAAPPATSADWPSDGAGRTPEWSPASPPCSCSTLSGHSPFQPPQLCRHTLAPQAKAVPERQRIQGSNSATPSQICSLEPESRNKMKNDVHPRVYCMISLLTNINDKKCFKNPRQALLNPYFKKISKL